MPTRGRDPCSRFLATSLPLWSRVMQRKQRRFASIWAPLFMEWRYIYETGLVDTDLGFLQRFAAAIQGVLKEYP